MVEPDLHFTLEEYAARIAKVRRVMDARGIDVLICSDPSNMAWLTGYDGWSFYVHQCVLLAFDGDPVWYGRSQDANGARRTAFMDERNIIGYPDHYVQSEVRHPMDHLSGYIAERGWNRLRIGVEMDNYWFSAAAFASLQRNLPNARFTDATALVNWQRMVKSPQEIEYMRTAARSSSACTGASTRSVSPGCANATSSPRSTAPASATPPSSVPAVITRPSCPSFPPAPMPQHPT